MDYVKEDPNFEIDEMKVETYLKILNKVLFLSVSYFTVATELRLIASEKHRSN